MRDVMPWRESRVIMRVGSNTPAHEACHAKALPPPDLGVHAGRWRGHCRPATRAASTAALPAHVSFLLVNDVYRIEENKDGRGGMARFAAAVKAERVRALAEGRHLVCVHAGDTLSPSLLSSFDQGAHMIDLFNDVGLDVFVPGNHEFDFGKDIYFERMTDLVALLGMGMKSA